MQRVGWEGLGGRPRPLECRCGGFFVGALAVALEAGLSLELRPFKEAVLFALVFLVLLLRPQGLVAVRALRERV
jgi:branched-chain amino acid transport system permease protein